MLEPDVRFAFRAGSTNASYAYEKKTSQKLIIEKEKETLYVYLSQLF
jgi:hypothetical protein